MQKTIFPLSQFANEETPFYYYDLNLLDATIQALKNASDVPGYKVHYAVKANSNPAVLERIAKAGLGADTVSLGEIQAALKAGFEPGKIVFAGVGKTDREINGALEAGIGCFNVESKPELEVIAELAAAAE